MNDAVLPALPGSRTDAGTGPAALELFEGLLDDPGPVDRHREHRSAWYRDLVGPLVVPAADAEAFAEALTSADHGLRVLLAAPVDRPHEAARQVLRGARDVLVEQGVVDVVGVRLGLPDGPSGQAAERLLDTLDFSAPAWVLVAPGPGSDDALRVLGEDGAEHLTLALDGASPEQVAGTLRLAVDLDLAFRAVTAVADPPLTTDGSALGLLNLLAAVVAARSDATPAQLAAVLAGQDGAPIVSALRATTTADAVRARTLLHGVAVASVDATVAALVGEGLVDPRLVAEEPAEVSGS